MKEKGGINRRGKGGGCGVSARPASIDWSVGEGEEMRKWAVVVAGDGVGGVRCPPFSLLPSPVGISAVDPSPLPLSTQIARNCY